MGWGGRGGIRKGHRGRSSARVLSVNTSAYQIKGATLSLNSAIAEYGITKEDLADTPCQWRSCHGNAYPLLQRSDVEAVVAKKKTSDASYAAKSKLKADAKELMAAKAALVEATSKVTEIEARISNGGYLGLTGVNANIADRLPKTDAKRLYCLDDRDLIGLSVTYGRGMMGNASENYLPQELLSRAETRHGGPSGFLERRRKQQQRTCKKELDEWKTKQASASAAVARLEQQSSSSSSAGAGTASSSSSSSASSSNASAAAAPSSLPRASGKAPAGATPTTAAGAPAKSAFAVLMKSAAMKSE